VAERFARDDDGILDNRGADLGVDVDARDELAAGFSMVQRTSPTCRDPRAWIEDGLRSTAPFHSLAGSACQRMVTG
jgi:hypothetical protein